MSTETNLTANERFKRTSSSLFWGSIIIATLAHFAIFQFWPAMLSADSSFTPDELAIIDLLPEIEIPPPPPEIARPATPVVALAEIDEDITIAPTTFEENPVEDLPPPPAAEAIDISREPVMTPMTVRPEIRNRSEVVRAMERGYPDILRDAGIGGVVVVWFLISEDGTVLDRRIAQSSGRALLDEAALRVAQVYRFTPALNRNQTVMVWVQFSITFQVRG